MNAELSRFASDIAGTSISIKSAYVTDQNYSYVQMSGFGGHYLLTSDGDINADKNKYEAMKSALRNRIESITNKRGASQTRGFQQAAQPKGAI